MVLALLCFLLHSGRGGRAQREVNLRGCFGRSGQFRGKLGCYLGGHSCLQEQHPHHSDLVKDAIVIRSLFMALVLGCAGRQEMKRARVGL